MQAADVSHLVDEYGADIYRYCCRLSRSSADADDLYQQTFLKCLELTFALDEAQNPKAFLFSVVGGIWKNELRKNTRRTLLTRPVSLDDPDAPTPSDPHCTESSAAQRAQNETLLRAIQTLAPKFRIPITLAYGFDCGLEQIAKIEKVPIGTIKSRLHKARQLLKKEMEAQGYGSAEAL